VSPAKKLQIEKEDDYEETSAIRAMPGSKGVNPRDLPKSDSQLEWEIGKLNEKFKEIMKRK
jgi:hypothetical protein